MKGHFFYFISFAALIGANALAASEETKYSLPKSYIEAYKVDSQYGPRDAVLNALYPKLSKIELGVGWSYSPFSSLMSFQSLTFSLGYHFNRRHAIEPLWFSKNSAALSGFSKASVADRTSVPTNTLSVEVPQTTFAASYFFTPYYAKMHILPNTVAHFDTYLGIGVGLLNNAELFLDNTLGAKVSRKAVLFTAGLRFMFNERLALRLELRDFVQTLRNFNKENRSNTLQFTSSANIFFF